MQMYTSNATKYFHSYLTCCQQFSTIVENFMLCLYAMFINVLTCVFHHSQPLLQFRYPTYWYFPSYIKIDKDRVVEITDTLIKWTVNIISIIVSPKLPLTWYFSIVYLLVLLEVFDLFLMIVLMSFLNPGLKNILMPLYHHAHSIFAAIKSSHQITFYWIYKILLRITWMVKLKAKSH